MAVFVARKTKIWKHFSQLKSFIGWVIQTVHEQDRPFWITSHLIMQMLMINHTVRKKLVEKKTDELIEINHRR